MSETKNDTEVVKEVLDQYGIDLETAELIKKLGGITNFALYCRSQARVELLLETIQSDLKKVTEKIDKI